MVENVFFVCLRRLIVRSFQKKCYYFWFIFLIKLKILRNDKLGFVLQGFDQIFRTGTGLFVLKLICFDSWFRHRVFRTFLNVSLDSPLDKKFFFVTIGPKLFIKSSINGFLLFEACWIKTLKIHSVGYVGIRDARKKTSFLFWYFRFSICCNRNYILDFFRQRFDREFCSCRGLWCSELMHIVPCVGRLVVRECQ